MGSASDKEWCKKISASCTKLGVPVICRVTSAHKGTSETMNIIAEYEGKLGLLSTVQ